MTRRRRMLFTLSLVLAGLAGVGACKTLRREQPAELSEEERKKVEEARAEMEIGRNMAGRLLQFYGTYEDRKLAQYVNQIGNYVASFSENPERRYMFEIINTDMVNAFACPGGYVLVTLGAIRHAHNEAQLAHVLGHEAAHVSKRHMFDKLKSMNEDDLNKVAKEAEERHNILSPSMQARKRPDPETSGTGALLARYLSGSAAGLSILAAAKAGMSLMLEKGLGAELEYEADGFGTRYATQAGYQPDAMLDFLCRLEKPGAPEGQCELSKKKAKKEATTILEKTHPPVSDRMVNIEKVLAELHATTIVGAKGTKRFKSFVALLPPPAEDKAKTDKKDQENSSKKKSH